MWRSRTAWLALGGIVVASAVARFAVSTGVAAPWIAPDEIIYGLLGRSLYEHGTLSILGADTPFFSLVYPAVIGAPLALLGPATGLTAVQALQAVLMSAAAIPVFAWARHVASTGWALAAAALTVTVPGLAYSGLLMTEAAVYPLATVALWLLARALARPTLGRQAAFWGAAGLATATRLQLTLLVPAAVVAVAITVTLRRDRALIRPLLPTIGLAGFFALVALAATAADRQVLGAYTGAVEATYDAGDVLTRVVEHAGAIFLLVAGVPLIALVALTVDAARRRDVSPELAALLATALAWCLLLAVQVGVFASRFVEHLAERDLLSAVPVLFVVFAAWLARGMPRPQPLTAVAALLVAAPAILLPVHRVATQQAALDSFSTIPLRRLAEATSDTVLDVTWTLVAALVVVLAVLLPSRFRAGLAVFVGALLVAVTVGSSGEVRRLSVADEQWWFADASPRWIDDAATGPVTYLQADSPNWGGVWKHAFWNERIASVARLPGAPIAGPVPSQLVSPRFDGTLFDRRGRPLPERLVAAPSEMALVGEPLAGYGPAADLPGLRLWRVDEPARLSSWTSGVQPNGDLLGTARVKAYDCPGGRLELTLFGKQGLPVRFRVDGAPAGEVTLRPGRVWHGSLSGDGGSEVCEFELDSPGLTGSTRIEFVR
ncbi:MAG TPA: glycosyltransferase family 39 protein [Gaiellaceae bacterium]|nr:glycosyltransferase family 39 protein [Gaiellaceae bacterium]